jgi:hypothetical protein
MYYHQIGYSKLCDFSPFNVSTNNADIVKLNTFTQNFVILCFRGVYHFVYRHTKIEWCTLKDVM